MVVTDQENGLFLPPESTKHPVSKFSRNAPLPHPPTLELTPHVLLETAPIDMIRDLLIVLHKSIEGKSCAVRYLIFTP